MKVKIERFYYLGFSLGKVLDLGNVINTVYTLLQLFEEFEIYSKPGGMQSGGTLEKNAILRLILPQNTETLSSLQCKQEKKFMDCSDFRESLDLQLDTKVKDKSIIQEESKSSQS
mmetsp:Transcript_23785/g.23480  ORF Transcript_23785/g.23480 Transcript_23785/m.23480 type:complete len:115 (+) Transcript_23785:190-534(+)|eukprot:CAMPEP_0170553606 /NCGR_PEP_ID=MMETSP0211-20121228/11443_1 /TAXON_ID=311385 /ORGANISM="Pseudokeronopsis sp., Strain OXSARD2" /LENGTH=114 /DNA_ID=CAMNT_0010862059 /DNA_START=149 /DNA_END=493 /DNA_ORIENTATION=-